MSKGDTEEQLARDRLREKLFRKRGPRKKVQPKMTGMKVCLCCGKCKRIKSFGTHPTTPDGRRYECRLCRWEERWHRQLEWSKKHMPDGGTRRDMRKKLGFRQAERIRVREYWYRTYKDLGFPEQSFGSLRFGKGKQTGGK